LSTLLQEADHDLCSSPPAGDISCKSRVELGHTRLTHSHLLSGEPPPVCCDVKCNLPFNILC